MLQLRFSSAIHNAKLNKLARHYGGKFYTFSALSGHNCPYAKDCHSKAIKTADGMRIQDGAHTIFRCFSASQEVLFPALYRQRAHNSKLYQLVATDKDAAMDSLLNSLPKDARLVRCHVGGDFPTQSAFDLWLDVARLNPTVHFYAYTKSLPFWVKRISDIPPNFVLTASKGGYKDNLIDEYNLRYAEVVNSEYQARKLGLKIDHDDSRAAKNGPSFGLLVHGAQPVGSAASKAVWRQRRINRINKEKNNGLS